MSLKSNLFMKLLQSFWVMPVLLWIPVQKLVPGGNWANLETHLSFVSLDKKPVLRRPTASADAPTAACFVQDINEHQQHETAKYSRCTQAREWVVYGPAIASVVAVRPSHIFLSRRHVKRLGSVVVVVRQLSWSFQMDVVKLFELTRFVRALLSVFIHLSGVGCSRWSYAVEQRISTREPNTKRKLLTDDSNWITQLVKQGLMLEEFICKFFSSCPLSWRSSIHRYDGRGEVRVIRQ